MQSRREASICLKTRALATTLRTSCFPLTMLRVQWLKLVPSDSCPALCVLVPSGLQRRKRPPVSQYQINLSITKNGTPALGHLLMRLIVSQAYNITYECSSPMDTHIQCRETTMRQLCKITDQLLQNMTALFQYH